MKTKRFIGLFLGLLMLFCCTGAASFASEAPKSSLSLSDLDGKRIGVITGSIHDAYIRESFPNAKLSYFSSFGDMITAMKADSIDAFSSDLLSAYSLLAEDAGFSYIDDPLARAPTAFAFSKDSRGEKLCREMNDFLAGLEKDGTLAQLQEKWLGYGAQDHELDLNGFDKNAETLVFATSGDSKPCSYYYNGSITGYEVELAALFCREYGYNLEISVADFAGIIPGLCSNRFDFAADAIGVTEERSQSVNFSSPDFYSAIVMVVAKDEAASSALPVFTTIDQFNREGVNVGLVTGMATDLVYAEIMPKATVKYYNGLADILNALSLGQIDGYLIDEPMGRYLANHTEGVGYIDEVVGPIIDVAFVLGKTDFDKKLKTELDEFIRKIKADGTISEILELWYGSDEENQHVTIPTEGKNGTIKLATDPENAPIVMLKDEELCGVEIDILSRFCTEYGYALDAIVMNFDAIISSVDTGRADIGCSFISVTDERKETVIFSEPYHSAGMLMEISAPAETQDDFRANLAASFERTFIRENRWELIVKGIQTTLLISLCAAVLGTVLGFGLCLLRRMKSPIVHGFTTVYIRVLQGTPLLVLLMILYYIIFAKSSLSGELVAIFAFALNFAAYVCEMFRTGIDSVDIGQTEAAYAIGYTKTQTFFRIVMPQAAMHFLPVYKGEFISLLKMTSIVGYIAVQDLTKMSDIIRSRTYEAFFPLIATAVIYFILSALLTSLLRLIEIKVEPDRKNRTVKGVVMQ